jgi:phosphoribosylformimino-5-aminoimidazole carboxamide ribotide isomerase
MRVIPAIDLMGGKCVRLIKGEKKRVITYDKDPLEIAEEYMRTGAKLIHIVDLDGAFSGEMKNLEIIKALAKRFPIQVGGGIRSEEKITELLGFGVKKVIVSTLLLKDKKLSTTLKRKYKGQLIGSFDFKEGKLSYEGWTKQSTISFREASKGLEEIVVTDTSRDGTFEGPNLELLQSLKDQSDCRIIAAGGVRDIEDLIKLKGISVDGAIIGRACLEKTVLLREAFILEFSEGG